MDYINSQMQKLVNAAKKKEEQFFAKGGPVKECGGGNMKAKGGMVAKKNGGALSKMNAMTKMSRSKKMHGE